MAAPQKIVKTIVIRERRSLTFGEMAAQSVIVLPRTYLLCKLYIFIRKYLVTKVNGLAQKSCVAFHVRDRPVNPLHQFGYMKGYVNSFWPHVHGNSLEICLGYIVYSRLNQPIYDTLDGSGLDEPSVHHIPVVRKDELELFDVPTVDWYIISS